MTRARQRQRSDERGQALVEFAVVVPLVVMVVLFAIWFYELIHVKLKVQEAARYAAWETTAFPMHSYMSGTGTGFSLPGLGNLGGGLGGGLPGAFGQQVGQQVGQQINQQVSQLVPFGGFGLSAQAVGTVSAETIVRYADMNSATLLPTGSRMLSASWTPPLVYALDEMEEPIYGGPLVNLIFGVGGAIFDAISAMGFGHGNQVATSLIRAGKDMGSAGTSRMFGDPEWNFNRRGYIHAKVAVAVRNEWFGSGVGRMILPNAQVVLREEYGLLADDWGLQDGPGQIDAGDCRATDPRNPGYAPKCALWQQVQRMYLVKSRARQVFTNRWLRPFVNEMRSVLGQTRTALNGPTVDEIGRPSVVSRPYAKGENGTGDADAGKVEILEDTGVGRYDTAPTRGEYGRALRQRGKWFMGCRESMQLGCTDTLSQENPFGDYIVRE